MIRLTTLCLVLSSAAWSSQEVVTLKSGKQVKGLVVDDTTGAIELVTTDGEKMKLDKMKVKRLARARDSMRDGHDTGEGSSELTASASFSPSRLRLGPQLGLSASNATVAPATSTSNRAGLLAGLNLEVKASDALFIQTELMYAQLGYVVALSGVETTTRYDVLRVPVLLKTKFNSGYRDLKLALLAGPSAGFRVKAESEVAGNTTDLKPSTESVVFSMDFGGGLDYAIAPRLSLILDLRFSLGLNNVTKVVASSIKNSDMHFLGGIVFGI